VIDAEVVACNNAGVPDFRALHSGNYAHEQLRLWCFDLLFLNGNDLRPMPLVARKVKRPSCNATVSAGSSITRASAMRNLLLVECRKRGLEGIVSKKKDAPYRSGKCWIKVKCAEWRAANKDRGDLFQQTR
jgi:bifunctional non-homologous end joining protein LigD